MQSEIVNRGWLPDMDLNHDKQIQSLLCYRYTIGQTSDFKVEGRGRESRLLNLTVSGDHLSENRNPKLEIPSWWRVANFPISDFRLRISGFEVQEAPTRRPRQGQSPHMQNS